MCRVSDPTALSNPEQSCQVRARPVTGCVPSRDIPEPLFKEDSPKGDRAQRDGSHGLSSPRPLCQ